jgi:hypothetical protein
VPSWNDVQAAAPELAGRVQDRFDAHLHKVMATLRADGSPRVSATEAQFRSGELWFGSMTGAVKARDLQRDPRVALHSAPIDEEMGDGDAKISGRAIEVTDPESLASYAQGSTPEGSEAPADFHLFRVDVEEIVLTTVDQERQLLVVDSWNTTRGLRRAERT